MALNLTPEVHPNHNGTQRFLFVPLVGNKMQEGWDGRILQQNRKPGFFGGQTTIK